MNSGKVVIEAGSGKPRTIHRGTEPVHRATVDQHSKLPEENPPEMSEREKLLRELLDESHERIRVLEAQMARLRSALIKAKLGEEE